MTRPRDFFDGCLPPLVWAPAAGLSSLEAVWMARSAAWHAAWKGSSPFSNCTLANQVTTAMIDVVFIIYSRSTMYAFESTKFRAHVLEYGCAAILKLVAGCVPKVATHQPNCALFITSVYLLDDSHTRASFYDTEPDAAVQYPAEGSERATAN